MTPPATPSPPEEPRKVRIDLLVLLKIINACRSAHPLQACGKLLGFEGDEGVVEVTDCFALPQASPAPAFYLGRPTDAAATKDADRLEDERRKYEAKMLDLLEASGSDTREVGIFQTFQPSSLKEFDLIDRMAVLQKSFANSFLLGFDPSVPSADQTQSGLKAFRLSKQFMRLRAEASASGPQALNLLRGGCTIETLSIEVHCGAIARDFLFSTALQNPMSQLRVSDFESLALNEALQLRSSLDYVCECLDEIPLQFERYQRYQKEVSKQATALRQKQEERRLENDQRKLIGEEALPQLEPTRIDFPSQVPLLVMNNQIRAIDEEIGTVMLESAEKAKLIKEALRSTGRM